MLVNDSGLQGGGAETRMKLLLKHMVKHEAIETIVVASATSQSSEIEWGDKVVCVHLSGHWRTHVTHYQELIRQHQINIVQGHNLVTLSPQVFVIARRLGIPTVWFSHDYWPLCVYRSFIDMKRQATNMCAGHGWRTCMFCAGVKSYVRLAMFRQMMSSIDCAIAPAKRMKDVYESYGLLQGRWWVVNPWIDLDCFSSIESCNAQEMSVLFVGSLSPYKGSHRLVEAFIRLADEYPDLRLRSVGPNEDEYREGLQTQLKEHGLQDRVSFEGYMTKPDLAIAYRQALCLVFPSVAEEAVGLIWIEAMASGCPVIGSRAGGMFEHAQNQALFYQADDAEALANCLRQYLSQPHLRAEKREAGLRLVRETYAPQKALDTLLSLYTSLRFM